MRQPRTASSPSTVGPPRARRCTHARTAHKHTHTQNTQHAYTHTGTHSHALPLAARAAHKPTQERTERGGRHALRRARGGGRAEKDAEDETDMVSEKARTPAKGESDDTGNGFTRGRRRRGPRARQGLSRRLSSSSAGQIRQAARALGALARSRAWSWFDHGSVTQIQPCIYGHALVTIRSQSGHDPVTIRSRAGQDRSYEDGRGARGVGAWAYHGQQDPADDLPRGGGGRWGVTGRKRAREGEKEVAKAAAEPGQGGKGGEGGPGHLPVYPDLASTPSLSPLCPSTLSTER